jgi:serine/threonine protein kinase
MDWIVNGDLARFIEENPGIAHSFKLRWVTQIAECFHLLHKYNISHYDTKLEKFLVDENYDLKICDFESSHNHETPSTSVALQPSRYRRPVNDFREEVFNPADDIFAFASICYEIIKGAPVFPSLDDESMEHQFGLGNFPETKDLCFGPVIQGCWTLWFTSFEEVLDAARKESIRAGSDCLNPRQEQILHLQTSGFQPMLKPISFTKEPQINEIPKETQSHLLGRAVELFS